MKVDEWEYKCMYVCMYVQMCIIILALYIQRRNQRMCVVTFTCMYVCIDVYNHTLTTHAETKSTNGNGAEKSSTEATGVPKGRIHRHTTPGGVHF
jgi:hypothetical protein